MTYKVHRKQTEPDRFARLLLILRSQLYYYLLSALFGQPLDASSIHSCLEIGTGTLWATLVKGREGGVKDV